MRKKELMGDSRWADFSFQVSVNVASGLAISLVLGVFAYLVLERWFESYVRISTIAGENVGKDDQAQLSSTNEINDCAVAGKVGAYFAKRRFEYEVGVFVRDNAGVYYLQDRSGKIESESGSWSVDKVILKEPECEYRVFAVVARSISEIREKAPEDRYWRSEEEFEKVKSYIAARSKDYWVKRRK